MINREVGLGLRLTNRAKRIGGVMCTYSLRLCSKLSKAAVPDWEAAKAAAVPVESHKKKPKSVDPQPGTAEGQDGDEDEDDEEDDEEDEEDDSEGEDKFEAGSEDVGALFPAGEEEKGDETGSQSLFYAEFSPGLKLQFKVTLTSSTVIHGSTLPAFSSFVFEIDKDKLYELVADRDLLFTALRVTYKQQFTSNRQLSTIVLEIADPVGPEALTLASSIERAWDRIGISLCSTAVWLPQGSVREVDLSTAYDTAPNLSLSEKVKLANSLMFYCAFYEPPARSDDRAEVSREDKPVLGWSTVVFGKAVRLQSMSETRPKDVLLQVCLYCCAVLHVMGGF